MANPPDDLQTGLDRGHAALAIGELELAAAAFAEATAAHPASAEAWHALAMVQLRLGQARAAIGSASMATDLEPNELLYWTALSQAFVREGLIAEAEDAKGKARILGLGGKVRRERDGPKSGAEGDENGS